MYNSIQIRGDPDIASLVGKEKTAPATATYSFTALQTPETYFFRYEVQPAIMTRQFFVE